MMDKFDGGRKWLSEGEAAAYIGVARRTMQRWRKNKGIVLDDGTVKPGPKYYQPAGNIRYDRDELDAWIVGNAR